MLSTLTTNPFQRPRVWRQQIIDNVKLRPEIRFNGKGFICALINSRCPIGCEHCMFFSNMGEGKNSVNTMTKARVDRLMKLVRDSNTGYLLVSGGGEGFLEPELMYQIAEGTNADVTWFVTSAFWAKNPDRAREVVRNMYQAFLRGEHQGNGRKICVRVSLDSQHIDKISQSRKNPLQHVLNLVRIFETEYPHEDYFVLMIHSMQGQESLIDELCEAISGEKIARHDPLHDTVKITESAFTIRLKSGYEFEVTFAKLLLSDLAADLRDRETLKKRIDVFERDAFHNERGSPAIKYDADGKFGPNMLVIYNGRASGGWQSEMPDVHINIDVDDFESITQKTLSDPGVLGTIENGLKYRFDIIQEVNPRAVLRSKAVNVRDYTSLVLLEEDKVKLYYSLRVLQDFIAQSRVDAKELESWPDEIRLMVNMSRRELQALYHDARHDIVQQFIESDELFGKFVQHLKQYARERNHQTIIEFFESNRLSKRTEDKWRLLMRRIINDWYDQQTFNEKELNALEEIEDILNKRMLDGNGAYEGLSIL